MKTSSLRKTQNPELCSSYTSGLWEKTNQDERTGIFQDCTTLLGLLENKDLYELLCVQMHRKEVSFNMLDMITCALHLNVSTALFIQIILENGDLIHLRDIFSTYKEKYEKAYIQLEATLITGKACNPAALAELKKTLEEQHGKKIILENLVHPGRIGGASLTVEGVRADMSYSHVLEQLESFLSDQKNLAK